MYGSRGWCFIVMVCVVSGIEDVMVFVTDKSKEVAGQIHRINVTSRVVSTLPLFKVIRPVAIGYDNMTENIYWSDVMSKELRSAKFDGSKEETLLDLDTNAVPDGLTMDLSNRRLFYTDAGNRIIWGVDLDGRHASEEIINTGLENPRAIIAYPSKRLLIWTDWAVWAKIERCNYDGNDRKTLVNTDIEWPNGITLDEKSDTVYWCDAGKHRIDSVKLDGTNRKQILDEPGTHYFGLFFFEEALYLTDWKTKAVRAIYLNGTEKMRISAGSFQQNTGIYVTKLSRCSPHTYGENCNIQCGECVDGVACTRTTGLCTEGCKRGYYGSTGEAPGYNFSMCNQQCGHCKAKSCHYLTGECPYGCEEGWSGQKCDTETMVTLETSTSTSYISATTPLRSSQVDNETTTCGKVGYYGDGCKYLCGACADNATCHGQTGDCPQHCACGWEGSKCNKRRKDLQRNCPQVRKAESSKVTLKAKEKIGDAMTGMIAVTVALLIVIIVLVAYIIRSRQPKESQYDNLQFNNSSGTASIAEENTEYFLVSKAPCGPEQETNANSQLNSQPDVLLGSDKRCNANSDDEEDEEDEAVDKSSDPAYASLQFGIGNE
ncbi:pro-epidermal growth factor-like isoform X1 [Haliotis cracherodii]|uniref:pro-epidermal growth factor-like isoform X1 n=1 Tax=Haliotis cracherodii TaxID=6455 RepID=UPI0039E83FBA